MISSNSLQPPKSGTSRFSKALPAVPGLSNPVMAENVLPPLPLTPRKDLPLPPTRSDATAPSLETPFSPLSAITSPTSSVGTPTSVKSKMTIPRRPVGAAGATQKGPGLPAKPAPDRKPAPPVQPPAQTLDNAPAPPSAAMKTATSTTPNYLSSYIPPPSPSASLSSLLSAYSRSSIGSPVVSSEGTASSTRDSQQTTSPSQFDKLYEGTAILTASSTPITPVTFQPVPPPKESSITNRTAPQQPASYAQPKPSLSPVPVETAQPPPPPAKASSSTQQPSQAPTQHMPLSSDLSAPSPARPQIWRRRSINKSKDLPPITIHSSHGSTASTTPQVIPKPDPETASVLTQSTTETIKPLPPLNSAKPRPPGPGLPGRNVRPAQTKQTETELKTEMGGETSKLGSLPAKPHLPRTPADNQTPAKSEPAKAPAAGRPPTPEYQKEDVKTPILETFISPVSPASSPEPGREAPPPVSKEPPSTTADQTPKKLPKLDTASVTQKVAMPTSAPDLQSIRSVPDLRSATPSPPTAQLPSLPPAIPPFAANRQRRPSDAGSIRGRESTETSRFPPRGSSAKPEARQRLASSQFSAQSLLHAGSPDTDPRLVRSDSGSYMYRGRDGTLYPEMKDRGTADPKACYFPTHPQGRIPDGTILPAPPLRNSHYVCYQKHRTMGRRNNRQYPLACQTCDKADVEDRWVCTFCQLRICSSCNDKFNSKGRDLKQFMGSMKSPEIPNVLSLSSSERPGSALGLQINF